MNQFDQYRQVQTFKLSEVEIEAPADVVWPYLVDFSSFNDTFEKIELLSGAPNTVGAISRLTKRQGKWWIPPYFVKIIHIDPGRQIIWKMYPEEGEDFSAFVDFSLREVDRKTVFSVRHYKENRVSVRSPEARTAFSQEVNEAAERLHRELSFPNLKRLAERGRGD